MQQPVRILLALAANALTACGSTTEIDDSRPAHFSALAGDGQVAVTQTSVPIAPAVIVTNARNQPVAGIPVTFTVAAGGGSVQGAAVATNADGEARVGSWRLGAAGATQTLIATIPSFPDGVVFNAQATSGPVASMTIVAGSGQSGARGAILAGPLSVMLRDALGNPARDIPVVFQPVNGGTATPTVVSTSSNGIAGGVTWRLPTTCSGVSGNVATLIAVASSISVTFQATCL